MGYSENIPFYIVPPMQQCVKCGEDFLPHELVNIDGEFVCDDCLGDFLKEDYVIQNHLEDFLQSREKEFLVWWFSGDDPNNFAFLKDNAFITEAEKTEFLRGCYKHWKPWHMEEVKYAEREFLFSTPGEWEDYLKGLT